MARKARKRKARKPRKKYKPRPECKKLKGRRRHRYKPLKGWRTGTFKRCQRCGAQTLPTPNVKA